MATERPSKEYEGAERPGVVVIGPWGGFGGQNYWYFKPDGRIVEIYVTSGDFVHSIMFTYIDQNGDKHQSEKYGGNSGSVHTITFAEEEDIILISGTSNKIPDRYNSTVISSLSFQTNNKTYGPYGKVEGKDFVLSILNGQVVGFHGHYSKGYDKYLHSFGLVLKPTE